MPTTKTKALDWSSLAPRVIYPTKLLIIEAMQWIGRPLSASELEAVLGKTLTLSVLSYHLKTLAKQGILTEVRRRRVRGAWEKFYFFDPAVLR